MAVNQDPRAKTTSGERKPTKTHRETLRALWLPMPEAPANDNERGVAWRIFSLFRRHFNWLAPTVLLALLSITLLSLNHH